MWDADRGVIDLLLRYLRKHGVGGVGVRAEVFEWVEVGEVGREMKGLEERWGKGKEDEVRELAEGLKAGMQGESVGMQAEEGGSGAAQPETSKEEGVKTVKDTVDGA